ncbi:putative Cyclase/dehydrase [Nostocoides japonicum T1-X7]|uniref:Putative Cyclase/dehydrase n=1 Tax=Nostocoides japonicum T1-X7 TaxID=1194083 RepID=A0A077LYC7_9MICO|nr:SRPBCC family protein [Tetrasphaera japonica]CCH78651.1 putative Cyclase/dehydrase [Tetrasphaera japonica T1-X7]
MIEITKDSTASPEDLWAVTADVEHWGDVLPTFEEVRHVGGPSPTGIGTRFEVRQPGLSRAVYEVTAWEPGREFVWVARLPGVTTTASHTVSAAPTGSQVRLTLDWSGPLAFAVRLLLSRRSRAMAASEGETLARLAARR